MPRVVGRYEIHDVLASGGMAQVHLGTLKGAAGYARVVAVKRLHPHLATDADFLAMFVDEARLATRIRHANVVPTLDVIAADGELFVVMEYVHGEALSQLVKIASEAGERVPLPIVVAIVCDLLHGLHAAHEAKDERGRPLGIVHRDVSPHNVLVGTDGTARVADFGVAKAAGRLQSTREGELKGKLMYMAPELLRGAEVARTVDVYAASVVLWQAATGQRLFRAQNDGEVVPQILEGKIAPPSEAANDPALAPIDAITKKGLAQSPSDRFATAREMAEALEAAVPPAPRARVGEWVERIARGTLAKRTRLIEALETSASGDRPTGPKELLEQVRSAPTLPPDEERTRNESRPPPRAAEPEAQGGTQSRLSNMTVARAPSADAPRSRGRGRLTTALALGFAAALAFIGWRARVPRPAAAPAKAPAPTELADAAPAAKAITDWPLPTGAPEALEAYKAGLHSLRIGARNSATRDLRRAATLDPAFAAANLRLSLSMRLSAGFETERRQTFKRALDFKDRLSERDQRLAEAFEPYLAREPTDARETARRLAALSARSADDAEAAYYLGTTHSDLGEFPQAIAAFSRATAIDPGFAMAWAAMADTQAYAGDSAGGLRSAERCLATTPAATECSREQFLIHRMTGDCSATEADAKREIAIDPESPSGYWFLAEALAAQDRSPELVGAAIDQYERRVPPDWRPNVLRKRIALDLLAGDFVAAGVKLEEMERISQSNPGISAHSTSYRWMVDAAEETGRTDAAKKTAARFVERYDLWVRSADIDDAGMQQDALPLMLGTLLRLGALSHADFATRRDAWVERWKSTASGSYVGYIWAHAYAMAGQTHDTALEALGAMDAYAPLPTYYSNILSGLFVGRLYLRAGRASDAVAPLKGEATTCRALLEPLDQTHAVLDLAGALEQTGARDDACASYARVVRRWGAAKPKSLSADRARARMAALKCAR